LLCPYKRFNNIYTTFFTRLFVSFFSDFYLHYLFFINCLFFFFFAHISIHYSNNQFFKVFLYIYLSHLLGWSVVLALTVVVIFAVVFVLVDWILTRQKRRHQYRCRYLLQKDQEYSSATCLQERQHRRNQIRTLLM
jgi:hypothetical protein